jgi:hypothetical protein
MPEATPHANMTRTTHKRGAAPLGGDAKGRISPKLRDAIKMRVEKALTISECCRAVGISEAGYYAAMKRPVVAAYVSSLEANFIKHIEQRRSYFEARAVEVAAEMLEQADDKAARWKAVEFFTRQAQKSQPVQQFNVNLGPSGAAYAYPQQGRNLIDVTPNDGQQTGSQSDNDTDAS